MRYPKISKKTNQKIRKDALRCEGNQIHLKKIITILFKAEAAAYRKLMKQHSTKFIYDPNEDEPAIKADGTKVYFKKDGTVIVIPKEEVIKRKRKTL